MGPPGPSRWRRVVAYVRSQPNALVSVVTLHQLAYGGARVDDEADRRGRGCDVLDVLIAATALERDALVATRNVRVFEPLAVDVIDPWST